MKKTFLFLLIVFFFLPILSVVKAASFSFDKNAYPVAVGTTVQVQISIDSGEEEVDGADLYVNYDSSFLSVEGVAAGSFFPTVTNDTATSGRIYIAGLVEDPASPKKGSGVLATVTFKGLKDGTTNLTFDCNLSKITKHDVNASNILNCSSLTNASIVVGSGSSGSSSNSSENSSANSSSANQNQPQTLPKSGIFDYFLKFAVPGIIFFIIGGGVKFLILK